MTYASKRLSLIFSALADQTRRGIFDELRQRPQSVTDLANTRPVSRPAVSQHLKVLENADLVFATPKGSHRIYSAHADGLADLRRYLDRVWDQALLAYAAEITTQNKQR